MRRAISASGVVLIAVVGLTGLDIVSMPETRSPAVANSVLVSTGAPRTYEEALARLDEAIRHAEARSREADGEWLVHEAEARLHLRRAKLTGSFYDYANAEAALRKAFEVADPEVGPHLTAALFNFSVHRLDAASAMLDRIDAYAVPPTGADRAELLALRGDLAFYRGDYKQALDLYRQSNVMAQGTADFRLGIYYSKTGGAEQADGYLHLAAREVRTPESRAFLELHRGILDLDSGRLDEALLHFRTADRHFPGYWLVEEHIAEVATLKRDFATATPMYRRVVAKTGHPEYMDSLADLAAARGQTAAATYWRDRAWREWQTRLRLFPEATYEHAVDHCLAKGDPGCAINLAVRNHAARPYGGAKMKLAEALRGAGRPDEAERQMRLAARSGWDTRR